MNVPRDAQVPGERPDEELPAKLATIVAKARARCPTPDMVAQLIARASCLGEVGRVAPRPGRSAALWVSVGATAAAAAVLLVFVLTHGRREPARVPGPPVAAAHAFPIYSAVTRLSLVDVGFGQAEEDLRRAEWHVARVSEAVALAAVRRDVQET